jgi:hypothetical protein
LEVKPSSKLCCILTTSPADASLPAQPVPKLPVHMREVTEAEAVRHFHASIVTDAEGVWLSGPLDPFSPFPHLFPFLAAGGSILP